MRCNGRIPGEESMIKKQLIMIVVMALTITSITIGSQSAQPVKQKPVPKSDSTSEVAPVSTAKEGAIIAKNSAESKALYHRLYAQDMALLKESLLNEEYINSNELLIKILGKVKSNQSQKLKQFFPKDYKNLRVISDKTYASEQAFEGFESSHSGVVFSRNFMDDKNRRLEINVLFSDDSIRDYLEIIQRPNLVQGMENTSVVSIQNFKGLVTISEDKTYFDLKLILNNELMVTAVSVGMTDHALIYELLNQIALRDLQAYFKK